MEPGELLDQEVDEQPPANRQLAAERMQYIGGKRRHGEVRKDLHQATILQIVGDGHAKLVGDASRVEGSLANRTAVVRVELTVRNDALAAGELEGPRPPGRQIAHAGMRSQVFDGLRPFSLRQIEG